MMYRKTSYSGLKHGWVRATFILREDYLGKIKSLAYWQRKNIKEIVDDALGKYLRGRKIRSKRKR